MSGQWEFWIDRGGTFADVIARQPDGRQQAMKLLSEAPEQYDDAATHAIRTIMEVPDGAAVPSGKIRCVKMGTTVATNALLERKGEPTLLVTTRGLRDQLRIGYQTRPKLFDLDIKLPESLYKKVLEVDGRFNSTGEELVALDIDSLRADLESAFAEGLRACAIVFIHSYRYHQHEVIAAKIAREVGFTQVSVSHKTSPLIKMVPRGDTTVVDAYLSPILRAYMDGLSAQLGDVHIMFMQSNGGLVDARRFEGKDSILSGPAGGIVGAIRTTETAGFKNMIGFDMGGTSTDVSHYCGEMERTYETEIDGIRIQVPMVDIHTVAAGGGSILHFDGRRYLVGPDSAGANPGPACYRRGGPLTVTDCNVMLGKVRPEFFPRVFGHDGDQPIDQEVVEQKFAELAADIKDAIGDTRTPAEVAEGFLKIAVIYMASAIKKVSIQRGHDVTQYALNCFGGAGGQHACQVADSLRIETVLLHPYSGVLSAYGMGLADFRVIKEESVSKILSRNIAGELDALSADLGQKGREELSHQGVSTRAMKIFAKAKLRYDGTDTALAVDFGSAQEMSSRFEEIHQRQFGFVSKDKALIIDTLFIEAVGNTSSAEDTPQPIAKLSVDQEQHVSKVFFQGEWWDTPVLHREALEFGHQISGPVIIVEKNATTIVEPGWFAILKPNNDLVLTREEPLVAIEDMATDVDPVMLEIFNNFFMSVAEQMGLVLQKTSSSVNIKERLDFSCAVFDQDGNLVANAPHVPVHLGSMSQSVKTILEQRRGTMQPGDVYMLNAPYNGGTHLPDVTIVTPVFSPESSEVEFFAASRGHHADVGGITPGSMPSSSTSIEEEGILIDDFKLVEKGRFREKETIELLLSSKYPARQPHLNIADFKAQVAANQMGIDLLNKVIEQFGAKVVKAYMKHVRENAEESVRRLFQKLTPGRFEYRTDMDDVISVAISIDHDTRSAIFDFTATSEQSKGNFNAPPAVTSAAVLYVLRCLVDSDIPLNAGCLEPIEIILPEQSLLSPKYPAAVVAGNVETSQFVTDVLLGALKAAGASQGTSNSFTFGNDRYQYYETICGGSGAGPDYNGASATHVHMTNTRLTDPEVLETRFPVLLEEFKILKGSGGAGRTNGGEGVLRRIKFMEPMTASILSSHRKVPPYGMAGGEPGKVGKNHIERADGTIVELSGFDQEELGAGDIFVIRTPGGGGYGKPEIKG